MSLKENAIDFLNRAIELVSRVEKGEEDVASLKYAVIFLTTALELLMKAILEKNHWCLVFKNLNKASKDNLRKQDFESVDFNLALERLEKILGIKLEEGEKKKLKSLQKYRNRILHYSVEINLLQAKSLLAKGFIIFINLYRELCDNKEEHIALVQHIHANLKDFHKFVQLKLREIQKEMSDYERPIEPYKECPNCLLKTIVFKDNDRCFCLYCLKEFSVEDLCFFEDEVDHCPKCGHKTFGFVLYNNDEGEFICIRCGHRQEYLNDNFICKQITALAKQQEWDEVKSLLKEWFYENYEEPVNCCPWDEGEYIYIWGVLMTH